MASVSQLLPLFRELNDLKRIRSAGAFGSVAERLFRRSWSRLNRGEELRLVALSETANAVIAAKLADIDAAVLSGGGLNEDEILQILRRAFDASAAVLPAEFAAQLRAQISAEPLGSLTIQDGEMGINGIRQNSEPGGVSASELDEAAIVKSEPRDLEFVESLARQPRAGATRPGMARVVLEPTENHAEHCAIVAVNCALASSLYDADAGDAFLTGLSHHFHNAYLPDAGDAGDALLGEYHAILMRTFRERALSQLTSDLAANARGSLDNVYRSDTPASKSFQAADALDRVLEMEWHARTSEFTLDVALEQMDIIHPGPVQAFQLEVMREAGFR